MPNIPKKQLGKRSKAKASLPMILFLFFLSGCSALTYEALWQRMMILVFGAGAIATTAILTSFFAGIAFGSYLGGSLIKRYTNTLALYGFTELWICLWGLAVPLILQIADVAYVWFHQTANLNPFFSHSIHFIMAILVVLPATFGMGVTIPIMNRLIRESGQATGSSVALAYGFNTIGAVIGCLATGFFWVRLFGVQNTLFLAAGLNAFVVLITFVLAKSYSSRIEYDPPVPSDPQQKTYHSYGLLIIYFCTGLLSLGYEILWFRILGIYSTNSVYTFALMLSVYLMGFSLGSLLFFPVLARFMRSISIFTLANWELPYLPYA